MNTCAARGYLISGRDELPTDPTDFNVEGLPTVGCNSLHCTRCNERVRNAVGVGFRTTDDVDVARVYATRDLLTCPEIQATETAFRLYLCKCDRWLETSKHPLFELDRNVLTDPDLPWHCGGHSLLKLPAEVDGIRIANHSELAEVTGRALHGWVPPGARPDDLKRATWACRLHERLGEDAGPMEDTVVAALDDSDPVVRARAIAFVIRIPFEAGMRRALNVLQSDRRSFAGVRDEITAFNRDTTLELSLWRAIGPLIDRDERARDLARAEALAPTKGSRPLYDVLSTHDAAWVLAHVDEIARATPDLMAQLGYSFSSFPRSVSEDEARQRLKAVQG